MERDTERVLWDEGRRLGQKEDEREEQMAISFYFAASCELLTESFFRPKPSFFSALFVFLCLEDVDVTDLIEAVSSVSAAPLGSTSLVGDISSSSL